MATKYANNLEIQLNEPIDTRLVCKDLADLNAGKDYFYVGLLTYCINEGKYFSFKGLDPSTSDPIWEELKTGSSGGSGGAPSGDPLKYLGTTTTELTNGSTVTSVIINGVSVTATTGSIVFYDNQEFIFNGTKWEQVDILNVRYDTALGSIATEENLGGIPKGTTASDLKNLSFTALFDRLLFPDKDPSYVGPSVSGFVLNYSSDTVALNSNVMGVSNASLNRGYWREYNDNAPYAGTAITTSYTININGITKTNLSDLPIKHTTIGDQTYSVTITYGAGEAPKNNKGILREALKAPAGSVKATRTVNVTMPYSAQLKGDSAFVEHLNKCTLVSDNGSSKTYRISLDSIKDKVIPAGSSTGTQKQLFKVYGDLVINMIDPFSGAGYSAITEFTRVAEMSNGQPTGYYIYSYKEGVGAGDRTIHSGTITFTV